MAITGVEVQSESYPDARVGMTLPVRLAKFAAVSGVSTGVDYAILFGLLAMLPKGHAAMFAAVAAGYLAGVLVHFFLSRRFVFSPSSYVPAAEFSLVVFIGLVGLGLNEAVVFLGVAWLHRSVLLSKTAAVGLGFVWNFCARHWWVYRSRS